MKQPAGPQVLMWADKFELTGFIPFIIAPKSEDRVVLRVDAFRLKERVTIHVETLALLFSSVKVKRQPIKISDEAKQRLKLGVPKMLKSYIELGINRTAGWTSASGISRMVELIVTDPKKVSLCSAVLEGIWLSRDKHWGACGLRQTGNTQDHRIGSV